VKDQSDGMGGNIFKCDKPFNLLGNQGYFISGRFSSDQSKRIGFIREGSEEVAVEQMSGEKGFEIIFIRISCGNFLIAPLFEVDKGDSRGFEVIRIIEIVVQLENQPELMNRGDGINEGNFRKRKFRKSANDNITNGGINSAEKGMKSGSGERKEFRINISDILDLKLFEFRVKEVIHQSNVGCFTCFGAVFVGELIKKIPGGNPMALIFRNSGADPVEIAIGNFSGKIPEIG